MEPSDFDEIFGALQAANVRYLVVGGVAVVLHGMPRFTADLDLIIALDEPNVRAAMSALGALGYRPRPPVPAEHLADPAIRRSWIDEKGLTVFSLWSPEHPATEIDVFVEEPFPFAPAYARALHVDLGSTEVTVASIADLIGLKRAAGRPKDLADIAALEALDDDA
ncbi:MAG TPA: nucleotidyl transferase AbiEii/AbiGii toxin family protein [Kofleriaceae bacterium]|nr:nucleotidyl transferase AbiEii/AbiGii toxin family protein [Kofleriaceae bacterium]